eukprot:5471153-Amphidinium_carterae.2
MPLVAQRKMVIARQPRYWAERVSPASTREGRVNVIESKETQYKTRASQRRYRANTYKAFEA